MIFSKLKDFRFFAVCGLLLFSDCSIVTKKETNRNIMPDELPGIICFWDFQPSPTGIFTSKGAYNYTLEERNGKIAQSNDGIFGNSSIKIEKGQWLRIKRENCPALNIHGKQEVSMVAWIKRTEDGPWQYIAGMWNERDAKRQYGLFTCGTKMTNYKTMERIKAENQTHGYVSEIGGATKDKPYCFSYATGKTKIEKNVWRMIAFTYDHKVLKVYVDGELDENGDYNPFYWDKPIFDGKDDGSDFTVAQRALPHWPGYPDVQPPTHKEGFIGLIGGLAVYNRALSKNEIKELYKASMQN